MVRFENNLTFVTLCGRWIGQKQEWTQESHLREFHNGPGGG